MIYQSLRIRNRLLNCRASRCCSFVILFIGSLLLAFRGQALAEDGRGNNFTSIGPGRQLIVNGKPFIMRAVAWNPVRYGQSHPFGLMYFNPSGDDLYRIENDFRLIRELGANTIRTYEPILEPRVLDIAWKYGLHIIVPALNYFQQPIESVEERVRTLKEHPTTLFWELGNEWNYNTLHGPIGFDGAKERIRQAAARIRSIDSNHPIASNYGELPPVWLVNDLPDIQIWGMNIYSGATFASRFQDWANATDKAMYIGEYGADAVNHNAIDLEAQSFAVDVLSREILSNLSAKGGTAIGGVVFEWCDEWWKDGGGSPASHDMGGIAAGGGPYPDFVFNEEWWGLVDIDRNIRPAYLALQRLWKPYRDAEDQETAAPSESP